MTVPGLSGMVLLHAATLWTIVLLSVATPGLTWGGFTTCTCSLENGITICCCTWPDIGMVLLYAATHTTLVLLSTAACGPILGWFHHLRLHLGPRQYYLQQYLAKNWDGFTTCSYTRNIGDTTCCSTWYDIGDGFTTCSWIWDLGITIDQLIVGKFYNLQQHLGLGYGMGNPRINFL